MSLAKFISSKIIQLYGTINTYYGNIRFFCSTNTV